VSPNADDAPFRQLGSPRRGGIVVVCDHAGNAVPEGIDLGVSASAMAKHIAWDIGTSGVGERLARRHGLAVHMAIYSRLVIDLHREEDSTALIPVESDGILIPGNIGADREGRLARYYRPYHEALAAWLDEAQPGLVISVHSFTPSLETAPADRPWEVGLLYNTDDRAALHAMRLFGELGLNVGDNEPYPGNKLNATMDRHAEAHGRPYCTLEIRNDLIADEAGQARWAAMIADVAGRVKLALDSGS